MKFNIEGEINTTSSGYLHLLVLCEDMLVVKEGGKFERVTLNTLKRCLNSYKYMELYKKEAGVVTLV